MQYDEFQAEATAKNICQWDKHTDSWFILSALPLDDNFFIEIEQPGEFGGC